MPVTCIYIDKTSEEQPIIAAASPFQFHESPSLLKKKKVQAVNEWLNILPKSSQVGKKPPVSVTTC